MPIVAFDSKEDLADCEALSREGLPLLVLHWQQLKLALLQPPHGMELMSFIQKIVQLLASHLNLFASRRLMIERLHLLFQKPRAHGTFPTFMEWIKLIEAIQPRAISREAEYREAVLYSLKSIWWSFGEVLNYARSDMIERIVSFEGCVIIRTSGLAVEMASLLASLFVNWAFETRENGNGLKPLIFVLDDALPLVRGGHASEAEGGINPLSTWSFLGRSKGIGFVVSAQCFSLISPALRNNADNIVCFGSSGEDALAIGRHLSLTPSQVSVLPRLETGEVVAFCRSSGWQKPVFGRVPFIE